MTPRKIAVFCNGGLHATEVIAVARRRFPEAQLHAVVPPTGALGSRAKMCVDGFVEMERERYSARDLAACARLVRRLRAERYDLFIVLFDSLQLNLLGGLVGARAVECWDSSNMLYRLACTFPGAILRLVKRRVWGFSRWVRISLPAAVRGKPTLDYRSLEPPRLEDFF